MGVSSETIEVRISGYQRLRELQTLLQGMAGDVVAITENINAIGGEIQDGTRYYNQLGESLQRFRRVERASRGPSASGPGQQTQPQTLEDRQVMAAQRRRLRAERESYIRERREVYQKIRQRRSQRNELIMLNAQLLDANASIYRGQDQVMEGLAAAQLRAIQQLEQTRRTAAIRGTRLLFRSRVNDSRNLGNNSINLTGELADRDSRITERTALVQGQMRQLERNHRASLRAAVWQRAIYRERANAALTRNDQRGYEEAIGRIETVYANLEREMDAIQRARSSLTTQLGRLNQERRSLRATGRGRSSVQREGSELLRRSRELSEVGGISNRDLRVDIEGRRVSIRRAVGMATFSRANVRGDIQGANDILLRVKQRLTYLERERGLQNEIADAEQRRASALDKLNNKFANLRAAGGGGARMQELEQLIRRLEGLRNTNDMPLFDRIVKRATDVAGMVATRRGAVRGPSQPIGGGDSIVGSPKNITATERGSLIVEELRQKLQNLSSNGATGSAFTRAQGTVDQMEQAFNNNNFNRFKQLESNAKRLIRIANRQSKEQADSQKQLQDETKRSVESVQSLQRQADKESLSSARARLDIEQKIARLAALREAGASGADFQKAEQEIARMQQMFDAGNIPQYQVSSINAGGSLTFAEKAIAKRNKDEAKAKADAKENATKIEQSVSLQNRGLKIQQDLLSLQDQGVDVGGRLLTLEQAITKNKQNGAQVSLTDLATLEQEVKRAGELVSIENSRLARARKNGAAADPRERLPKLIADAEKTQSNLLKAEYDGLGVSSQRAQLETTLNKVREQGHQISVDDLNLLKQQTQEYNRLLSVENTRTRNAAGISKSRGKIIGGVAKASTQLTSLLESEAIGPEAYSDRRRSLINIAKSARAGGVPTSRLQRRLDRQVAQIDEISKAEKNADEQRKQQISIDETRISLTDKLLAATRSLEGAEKSIADKRAKGYTFTKQTLDTTNTRAAAEKLYKIAIDQTVASTEELNKQLEQSVDALTRAQRTQSFASRMATAPEKVATATGTRGIVNRVAGLGARATSLLDQGLINRDTYNVFKGALIDIGKEAKSATTPISKLSTRLDTIKNAISSTEAATKAERKLDSQRAGIIPTVRDLGTQLTKAFDRGVIKSETYDRLRTALIEIAKSAGDASKPVEDLIDSLNKIATGVNVFANRPTPVTEKRRAFLERDSLTSNLNELRMSATKDKVYLGGTQERAISNIVKTFNNAVEPPKEGRPQLASSVSISGARNGVEKEIDRYKQIFAGLTNNPRFYGELLAKLPRESVTTTMAGAASDRAAGIGNPRLQPFRMDTGPGNLEAEIISEYQKIFGTIPTGITQFLNKIGSMFDAVIGRTANAGGGGDGGNRRPPSVAGGFDQPQDRGSFNARLTKASGNANELLSLKELARLSGASTNQLELLSQELIKVRNGMSITDREYRQLTKTIVKVEDAMGRRDPGADILTRNFGQRGGQAIGEGLIGGAFPLLFGQGAFGSLLGGAGGAAGGFMGGTLGFGLSLLGTSLGSAIDGVIQAAQDTGNMLRDLVGNFDQIKESGLLASRSQEKFIQSLIDSGKVADASALLQEQLTSKIGVEGVDKLKAAADAGDRMNRAMAELGVQIQVFVAGPLTDFLDKISGAIEDGNKSRYAGRMLGALSEKDKKTAVANLVKENINAGTNKNQVDIALQSTALPFGGKEQRMMLGGTRRLSEQDTLSRLTRDISPAAIGRAFAEFTSKRSPVKPKQEQLDLQRIESSKQKVSELQAEMDTFNKQIEGRDILKGLTDQVKAAKREQEDSDRQAFEARREYELQIRDIRIGVADKVKELEKENAQKQLEIIAKQGEIRQAQFKNFATQAQIALAGDDLASSLADAVSTYLGAQLSAQSEIEQRRKQFEIEISNRQVDLEKYKADVARSVSKLNLDTAKKIQDINININRRNEDAIASDFRTQAKLAKMKIELLQAENDAKKAEKQADLNKQLGNLKARGEVLTPAGEKIRANIQAEIDNFDEINKKLEAYRTNILNTPAPARLRNIPAIQTQDVSFAGVDAAAANGDKLITQFRELTSQLDNLYETGRKLDFIKTIMATAFGSGREMINSLKQATVEYSASLGDMQPAIQAIDESYRQLIERFKIGPGPELDVLTQIKEQQKQLKLAESTFKFYTDTQTRITSATAEAKNAINELLAPTSEYQKVLQQINQSGGININPEYNKRLLEAAKNLDNLNAKLKALNAINEISGGIADSTIQFSKDLLSGAIQRPPEEVVKLMREERFKLTEQQKKILDEYEETQRNGGKFTEAIRTYLENVANKTLDVILEFTLRPIQEKLFKDMAKMLGLEVEKNPLLQPIENIDRNLQKFVDKTSGNFVNKEQSQQQEPNPQAALGPQAQAANGIVPGPANAQAAAMPADMANAAGGNLAYFGETGRVRNGDPNWIHGHLQSVVGSAAQTIEDGIKLARAAFAKGIPVEVGSGMTTPIDSKMSDAQLRQVMANAISQHGHSGGGTAFDFWVPKTMNGQPTQVPLPLTDIRTGGNEGINGLLPGEKTFLGHLSEASLGGTPFGKTYPSVGSGPPIPVTIVADASGATTKGWDGKSYPMLGEPQSAPQPTPQAAPQLGDVATPAERAATALEGTAKAAERAAGAIGELGGSAATSTRATTGATAAAADATIVTQQSADATKQAGDVAKGSGKSLSGAVEGFQKSVGIGIQAISGIAMAVGGFQMMKQGGTYNTLMGLAGIFGSLSSITGMFGKGGSLAGLFGGGVQARAKGGPVYSGVPYIVGEKGPELRVFDKPGSIIPNDQLYVPGLDGPAKQSNTGRNEDMQQADDSSEDQSQSSMLARTRASLANRTATNKSDINTTPDSLPDINIRYESQTINNVEYVTVEQHRRGMQEAAKRGQLLAYQGMQNSLKVRRRVGV